MYRCVIPAPQWMYYFMGGVEDSNIALYANGALLLFYSSSLSIVTIVLNFQLSCSHIFCVSCIDTWFESENTCPICRAVVARKDNSWKSGATSKGIRLC
ncbi:unnamed protein product [Angiostrongylus costaricensis]|uniref:RING-type domain-containing protein n=1 Tax=Angiostrongylus costaricensis TaxID=334426 RepID=A0A0R3PLD1_ANGCS|nr:unnamed protein product [Angiostrongylus costaricensis]